jgi:hypothetical protein
MIRCSNGGISGTLTRYWKRREVERIVDSAEIDNA